MTTFLYRVSSGEVVEMSLTNSLFEEYYAPYWAVLTNPPVIDGTKTRDPNGDLRVLNYSKIKNS